MSFGDHYPWAASHDDFDQGTVPFRRNEVAATLPAGILSLEFLVHMGLRPGNRATA